MRRCPFDDNPCFEGVSCRVDFDSGDGDLVSFYCPRYPEGLRDT